MLPIANKVARANTSTYIDVPGSLRYRLNKSARIKLLHQINSRRLTDDIQQDHALDLALSRRNELVHRNTMDQTVT